MYFYYYKKGKLTKCRIPKNNHKVPKTKRLRKKKMWLFCGDCKTWFKRYRMSHGTRANGNPVCHPCLVALIKVKQKAPTPDL